MKAIKVFSTLAMVLLFSFPALAEERSVDVTGWYNWIDPSGDSTFDRDADDFGLEFDSETGFGAAVNIFWGKRISTELAVNLFEPEATLRSDNPAIPVFSGGSLEMMPITGTLQFHFNPEGRVDPYIGAGVAYVLFDNLDNSEDLDDIDVDSIDFDDDYGFVANAGVSFDITPNFAINLDAKYVPVKSSATAVFTSGPGQNVDVEINPFILGAGLQFQF